MYPTQLLSDSAQELRGADLLPNPLTAALAKLKKTRKADQETSEMQNGSENNRPGGNSGICPSKGSQRKEGNARKPGSDNSSDFTQSFVDYLTEKFSPKGLQSVLVLNAFRDPIAEMIQFF